ncbi:hypothetical protein ONZ45_g2438 [Pleurotus djamor]|nr:hypothetical protein ONZ45_g2438 [Pleurotus djamor]
MYQDQSYQNFGEHTTHYSPIYDARQSRRAAAAFPQFPPSPTLMQSTSSSLASEDNWYSVSGGSAPFENFGFPLDTNLNPLNPFEPLSTYHNELATYDLMGHNGLEGPSVVGGGLATPGTSSSYGSDQSVFGFNEPLHRGAFPNAAIPAGQSFGSLELQNHSFNFQPPEGIFSAADLEQIGLFREPVPSPVARHPHQATINFGEESHSFQYNQIADVHHRVPLPMPPNEDFGLGCFDLQHNDPHLQPARVPESSLSDPQDFTIPEELNGDFSSLIAGLSDGSDHTQEAHREIVPMVANDTPLDIGVNGSSSQKRTLSDPQPSSTLTKKAKRAASAARRAERAKNAHQARSPADRKWRSEKVHCTYCGKNVGKGNFYRHRNGRCVVKASVPCDLCGKEFNLFRAEEKIKLHKENGSCLNYKTKIRFWRGNDQPPSD